MGKNKIDIFVYADWDWLVANDFFKFNEMDSYAKEGFEFNLENYELDDGGYNILRTIDDYNIEDLEFLKGLSLDV